MPQGDNHSIQLLSVIVPAYQQEKTIIQDVRNIERTLQGLAEDYEILVVVDGGDDKTYENLSKKRSPKIKTYRFEKNQGKGEAVRFGMLKAKGDIIGFIDSGMDIHPNGMAMLLSHMEWYNADIIVGSKLHPVSKIAVPFYRKVLSRGYRLVTRLLFGFGVRDTQVGLKFFKRKVVRDVFPRLLVKRYAFDIEILAVAYSLGYKRVYEAPVEINYKQNSIDLGKLSYIVPYMLLDTFAIFYRLRILDYYRGKNHTYQEPKLAVSAT